MRHIAIVVGCVAILAGCYTITEPDFTCEPFEPIGQLNVVITPTPGLFGYGEIVFVGDTLPLMAEVRPVVGGSIDIWGSGGCKTDYGDPVPAAIQWSSSDERIARVSATGVLTGRAKGEAIITARAPSRNVSGSREIGVWVRGGGGP